MIAFPDTLGKACLPDDSNLLGRVSASRLQTFHQCRLKFFFRYVLKLKKAKAAALHTGSAVHHALQHWNRSRWRGERLNSETLRQALDSWWKAEQTTSPVAWESHEEESDALESSWNLVATYLAQTPIRLQERPEAVEVSVETDLGRYGLPILNGCIDLVRSGGRIVDFKTTAQSPNQERAGHLHELQLSCYALLYRDATGSREGGFELHHLVKLKSPKLVVISMPPMARGQEDRLFRIMQSYVEGVTREDWVPSPSPMTCACCEYFRECRSWTGGSHVGS